MGTRLAGRAVRLRVEATAAALDAVLIAGGYCFVMLVRTLGDATPTQWADLLHFLPLAVAITLAVAWLFGLYAQIWRHASVAEARRVLAAGLASAAVVTSASLLVDRPFPLSVSVFGAMAVTMLLGAVRFQSRLFAFNRRKADGTGLRVAVLGAGDAAAELVRSMRRDATAGLVPVLMLDDDERKQGRACSGVPVMGGFDDLPGLVRTHDLHQAILAVPSAAPEAVRRAADLADGAGVPLRVLPPVRDLVGGRVRTSAVRDLKIDDLHGRTPVQTDLASVRHLLAGRRVLVTGAGGSIGSEIARQVAAAGPARLLLLEHDETHLHELLGTLGDAPSVPLLADIRHREHVAQLFLQHRPEIVFHAAAHKHVPLLEAHPCEAVKTNVMGTRNVVDAAVGAGTERFVLVSTDKAVDPSSVMGATKRIGEVMTLAAGTPARRYSAVRFGNVLGSRGSVIPTFARQIEAGGPVTVTDARMTRFFMSIPEAVQLVLQAAALSDGGEIFMLEMGEPVRIIDLAKRMVRLSGYRPGSDIEIRVTGVRPGEKLEEELRTSLEEPTPTAHPSIVALRREDAVADFDRVLLEDMVKAAVRGDARRARSDVFAMAAQADGRSTTVHLDLRQRVTDDSGAQWIRSTT
jgi:FlaA1/EpsC-like NDP-sugar epimerase